MTDTEYNELISKQIDIMRLRSALRIAHMMDEYSGKWSELEEEYSSDRSSFENLFSIPPNELNEKNKMGISKLKEVEYPLCLCDLGRCYMAQERFYSAESLFYSASQAGVDGADVLLFSLYFENFKVAGERKLESVFHRVSSIDLWSDSVENAVFNDIFLGNAIVEFGTLCSVTGYDRKKGIDTLLIVINSNKFDAHEQVKRYAREQLMRIQTGK